MRFKFLQWNVWYNEKVDRIIQLLDSINADVLCLQELSTNTKANPGIGTGEVISSRLGYNAHIVAAQEWADFERDSQENGILTRYPFLSKRHLFVKEPGARDIRDYALEGRVYVEATLDIAGRQICVGTTHLSFSPRFEMTDCKMRENQSLLTQVKKNKNYIFSGDLNSAPSSPLIEQLSAHLVSCGPAFHENTWTTKDFDYQGFKETALNWRLDYVFASPDLRVVSSRTIATDVSDHLPVLVEFEI